MRIPTSSLVKAASLWMVAVAHAEEAAEFARRMNLCKAQIENRDAAALASCKAAAELQPRSGPALRNLGRANLLAKNAEGALAALGQAVTVDPDSAAVHYLTGLAYVRLSQFEKAIAPFESAARIDPHTAAIRYQLAVSYSAAGKKTQAAEQLKETVRLDPLHASALYKLAGLEREAGDQAAFQARMTEFARLRKLFGDETRSAEALETCRHTWAEGIPAPPSRGAAPMIDVRFRDATGEVIGEQADEIIANTVLEVDENGLYTLLAVTREGRIKLLRVGEGGRLAARPAEPVLNDVTALSSCITGDFHNEVPKDARFDAKVHALNDVFCVGPERVWLLKQISEGRFADVTVASGLGTTKGRRAAWVDYEHDGDVDLLVAGAAGAELWQNNGNGGFVRVTAEAGITATGPAADVAAGDLDANVAADLAVARADAPTLVFENQRTGQFRRQPEPPGPWPAALRVLLDDVDQDAMIDAVLAGERRVEIAWGRGGPIGRLDLGNLILASARLADFDNDGRLDLCAVGKRQGDNAVGAVRLWRNDGSAQWPEVTERTGLSALALRPALDLLAADLDGDADTDWLIVTDDGRLTFLRNEGAHLNGQLKVRLAGQKTNPLGLGTRVELRGGNVFLARNVSALPIELGLNGLRRIDSIQTLWTNGVVDNQLDFAPDAKPITILEKNVATGSCPFLYVWDGSRFRFVTDLLGNSPVGLPLKRGVLLPADPDEIVSIGPEKTFVPLDGKYLLQVTSEFREVLYLEAVDLLAVDHAPEVEVHPTDKLAPPPFPLSEVWALSSPARLRRAEASDGVERTEALRDVDGVFAPPGTPLPPPYRGMCQPLALYLDFGPLDSARPWVLALTGWLQYGDGSTNVAMGQDPDLTVIPPALEAETQPERWTPLDVTVGMPAGKTKTILCDLAGKLPAGTRRLRLTTTFEIRWDRIALLQRRLPGDIAPHRLNPQSATLRWRGFSEIRSRADGHPTTPDHAMVMDRPPWRTALQGWCTRYGDVLELVMHADGRMAVINAGDALMLEFGAGALPPVPKGQVRSFFFYSVGWDKDGDHNVVGGDAVEPLPIPVGEVPVDDEDWRLRYNTRWVPSNAYEGK